MSSSVRAQERRVALPWLTRLRWFAVIGQIAATVLAVKTLGLSLPVTSIGAVILATALSNLVLLACDRMDDPPTSVVPTVILLDVAALTILLYLTGGTHNPFSILYVVHVAIAVVVLGSGWAWTIVAIATACYVAVHFVHVPLSPPPSQQAIDFGDRGSLVLVMALIAYFVGRVMRSLRLREAELASARERARRGEHLASLTTLAAGAAHELGTPLGTIAIVAKEVELAVRDDVTLSEDAKLIRQEVDRCREILNRMRVDVLDDTTGSLDGSEGRLAELIDQLKADLKNNERQRVKFALPEPIDGQRIGRPAVLRRAVGVLLRNAFDASPAGASVVLNFQRRDGWVRFEVCDSGSGMEETVLRRAGEPFFTTKAPGAGMGLGLYLVRLVADTFGGRFELQSAAGKGTRSILELPDRTEQQNR